MAGIHILWDDSHIWGLLVLKALQAWEIPARLVRGAEVAEGHLQTERPGLLIVPGGNARRKAQGLGAEGIGAVRDFVASGGNYLGFCGGAGLGLSDGGLKLCPWCRRPFESRLQHLVSGHMRVKAHRKQSLTPADLPRDVALPVWWPARFAPDDGYGLNVLASYEVPAGDFWVADMRLADLPEPALSRWEDKFHIRLRPDFMREQPCLVEGKYGKGRYVLSYAHLETPASPCANAWLLYLLQTLGGGDFGATGTLTGKQRGVPEWNLREDPEVWENATLCGARKCLENIIAQGRDHFLLFERTPWLMGWRRGLPGLAINALYALLRYSLSREPGEAALAYWQRVSAEFEELLREFCAGVSGYLLAERLDMALSHAPQGMCATGLKEQRRTLFGPPPSSGGIYGELQSRLELLVYHLNNGA